MEGLWDLKEIGSFKLVTRLSILNRAGVRTHQCIDCTLRHISIMRSYVVKYLRFYFLTLRIFLYLYKRKIALTWKSHLCNTRDTSVNVSEDTNQINQVLRSMGSTKGRGKVGHEMDD